MQRAPARRYAGTRHGYDKGGPSPVSRDTDTQVVESVCVRVCEHDEAKNNPHCRGRSLYLRATFHAFGQSLKKRLIALLLLSGHDDVVLEFIASVVSARATRACLPPAPCLTPKKQTTCDRLPPDSLPLVSALKTSM